MSPNSARSRLAGSEAAAQTPGIGQKYDVNILFWRGGPGALEAVCLARMTHQSGCTGPILENTQGGAAHEQPARGHVELARVKHSVRRFRPVEQLARFLQLQGPDHGKRLGFASGFEAVGWACPCAAIHAPDPSRATAISCGR